MAAVGTAGAVLATWQVEPRQKWWTIVCVSIAALLVFAWEIYQTPGGLAFGAALLAMATGAAISLLRRPVPSTVLLVVMFLALAVFAWFWAVMAGAAGGDPIGA